MKNPIKFLKHIVKDPINTIDEANVRKKEIIPWLIGSLAVAVVFCVLDGILGTGILMIFGLIGVFAAMFFGFLLFVIKKAKEKFEALTCNDCKKLAEIKTPEVFAECVSYTVGKNVANYDGVSHPSSNDGVVSEVKATAKASVTVDIDLKCPHCGKVKKLEYKITPFKCSAIERKVPVRDLEVVKLRLENAVKSVVNDYNDPEKHNDIPYSIHSKNNPKYEERTKPQVGNDTVAYPRYNGVKIDYRKDVEEMVNAFFLENQLDGTIVDPSKPKKAKK